MKKRSSRLTWHAFVQNGEIVGVGAAFSQVGLVEVDRAGRASVADVLVARVALAVLLLEALLAVVAILVGRDRVERLENADSVSHLALDVEYGRLLMALVGRSHFCEERERAHGSTVRSQVSTSVSALFQNRRIVTCKR